MNIFQEIICKLIILHGIFVPLRMFFLLAISINFNVKQNWNYIEMLHTFWIQYGYSGGNVMKSMDLYNDGFCHWIFQPPNPISQKSCSEHNRQMPTPQVVQQLVLLQYWMYNISQPSLPAELLAGIRSKMRLTWGETCMKWWGSGIYQILNVLLTIDMSQMLR